MNAEAVTPFYQNAEFWINAFLALFTGLLFGATYLMVRRGKTDSERQAREMKESITAAVRSAEAMEKVAVNGLESLKLAQKNSNEFLTRNEQQLRAYLFVKSKEGTYQDRKTGHCFAVQPELRNYGATPAKNVRYRAECAVLPYPLPETFDFPLYDTWSASLILCAQQEYILTAIVRDGFCDPKMAKDVKAGIGDYRLYIWGEVEYEDVFGSSHYTKFSHYIFWTANGVMGLYLDRHNEVT